MTYHLKSEWTLAQDPPPALLEEIARAVEMNVGLKRFAAWYVSCQADGFVGYLTLLLRTKPLAEARAAVAEEKPKAEFPEHFAKVCDYVLDYIERRRAEAGAGP